MALVLRKILDGYDTVFNKWSDQRTAHWPLMGSPLGVLSIFGIYMYFVRNIGPRLMQNRRPFELKQIMMLYNVGQMLASLYLGVRALGYWGGKYRLLCEPVDFSDTEEAMDAASLVYMYFIMKVVDLLDTVFFVLRKKQTHVSFLHVYHHAGMLILSWSAMKFLPGGHGTSIGQINSFVHVIMYGYYLLSLFSDKYKKSLWWKKHITQLQIIQFFAIAMHYLMLLITPNCAYPWWVGVVVMPHNLFMCVLFIDFYIKVYVKKDDKSSPTNNHRNGYKQDDDVKEKVN